MIGQTMDNPEGMGGGGGLAGCSFAGVPQSDWQDVPMGVREGIVYL